jgi:hypothetical protein
MPYDPTKAKQLLAEAGYPKGIDAGEFVPTPPFFTVAEAALNDLSRIGVRLRCAPWSARLPRCLAGEEAARAVPRRGRELGQCRQPRGSVHLLQGQLRLRRLSRHRRPLPAAGRERDVARREALLHQIQQLTIDRVMFAPIMDYRTLRGVGPRLAEHMLDSMPLVPFPSLEDMKLKSP